MNLKYYLRGLGIGIVVSTLIVGIATDQRSGSISDEEVRQRARELGMVEASGVLADEIPAATAEKTEAKEDAAAKSSPKTEEAKGETEDMPDAEPEETTEKTEAKEDAAAKSSLKTEEAKGETEDTSDAEPEENTEKTEAKEDAAAKSSPKTEETKGETEDTSDAEPKENIEKAEAKETADKMATEESETVTITIQGGEGSYSVCKKLEEAGLVESAAAFDRYLYEKRYDKRIIATTYAIPLGASEDEIAELITGKK